MAARFVKYLSVCRGKNKPCLMTSRLRTVAVARNVELVPTSDFEKNSLDLDTIDASSVGPVDVRSNFDEDIEDGKLCQLFFIYTTTNRRPTIAIILCKEEHCIHFMTYGLLSWPS